ncbi:winged helix-turn-helix transcriptional regulator [Nocardia sp. NBC_00565]|uniref:winged helix-turn-helix transcriptional regulator n=1 Tax=Nocardia sp. NBC_00565 TaxID=2975993 RepID=UPI002E8176CC|nr:winged helix-turn-helix transcriptional regulator [Nocardia sp. NBC_00565]WUC03103.1 winged helix-turn-helix transcriptional regulator [Nocardia sp. NBC_00565]
MPTIFEALTKVNLRRSHGVFGVKLCSSTWSRIVIGVPSASVDTKARFSCDDQRIFQYVPNLVQVVAIRPSHPRQRLFRVHPVPLYPACTCPSRHPIGTLETIYDQPLYGIPSDVHIRDARSVEIRSTSPGRSLGRDKAQPSCAVASSGTSPGRGSGRPLPPTRRAGRTGRRPADEDSPTGGRKVLTERLNHLAEHGILERKAYDQRPRYEYILTKKALNWSTCSWS